MSIADAGLPESNEPAGWTAWPAAERPFRTAVVVLVDLALSVLAGLLGGDALWGATGLALLLISQSRWFLPTTYELDDDRLVAGFPLRRRLVRWRDARVLVLDPGGGWLSTSRRGRRAGIDLYWGRAPEAARDLVKRRAMHAVQGGAAIEIVEPGKTPDGVEEGA